jgi:hypothetical protein
MHTLGVVRLSAGGRLRIHYRIRRSPAGALTVQWSPRSDIRVHRDDGMHYITVRVTKDKNVKAWKHRTTYIPAFVKALDLYPVQELEKYILEERPRSGGYLLCAPLGRSGWRTTAYSNQANAFKEASAAPTICQ